MKVISKGFCKFTGVYIAIYMGPCRKSYFLLVRKFRASVMLDKWSPTFKLSDIKLFHIPDGRYIFSLAREPTCRPYLLNLFFDIFKSFSVFVMIDFWVLDIISTFFGYFQMFSRVSYDGVLSIGCHFNFTD